MPSGPCSRFARPKVTLGSASWRAAGSPGDPVGAALADQEVAVPGRAHVADHAGAALQSVPPRTLSPTLALCARSGPWRLRACSSMKTWL